MVNNKMIIVRVTKNQHERVRNNAFAKGYKTMSAYLRALALENDLIFEQKFDEIYEKLLDKETDRFRNSKENKSLVEFV